MKSCLKSPPPTPCYSVPGTPCGSGDVSPGSDNIQLPCLRKSVSFCEKDDGLEEFFEADDWDRTPAPVAPKLSYEDLLELKQIMRSLPRASYNTSSCLPFTTSHPATSSHPSTSHPPSFPISRLAASPSLTPSKWKNRDDSANVDPAILPYLDSVPIRLLPLLPTAAGPTENSSTCLSSSSTRDAGSATATRADPRMPAPPAPAISLQSPSSDLSSLIASPAPSLPSPENSTPTRRRPNFSFVPLLPVQQETKIREEPPVPILVHSAPQVRHLNMSFVPLLPPEDQPTTPTSSSPLPVVANLPSEAPSQKEAPHLADVSSHEHTESEEHASYFPIAYTRRRRSPTSTPSLSSASDTDTESDAPSVNSPDPSSPADDYDALTHYFASHPPFGVTDDMESSHTRSTALLTTHNPYFPSVPAHPAHSLSDAALSNPPMLSQRVPSCGDVASVVKKVKLEALPSPALMPPSPFSLYPPESEGEDADAESEGRKPNGSNLRVSMTSALGKRIVAMRTSGLSMSSTSTSSSSLSSGASGCDKVNAIGLSQLRLSEASPAPSSTSTSVSDAPELTIEAMREAYDQAVSRRIEVSQGGDLLGPSLSRRELSGLVEEKTT